VAGDGEEVAEDDGGWLLVSVSTVVLGPALWAVVTLADRGGDRHGSDHDPARPLAARFAAGAIGVEDHRRRLAVPCDDERRELAARR